jgi:hypothetical protein
MKLGRALTAASLPLNMIVITSFLKNAAIKEEDEKAFVEFEDCPAWHNLGRAIAQASTCRILTA